MKASEAFPELHELKTCFNKPHGCFKVQTDGLIISLKNNVKIFPKLFKLNINDRL